MHDVIPISSLMRSEGIFLTVPPTVVAESDSIIGIMGGSVVLSFTLYEDTNPPIYKDNITVTFNGTTLPTKNDALVQSEGNVLNITITSLAFSDEGVYAVTVVTRAGQVTAHTLLTIHSEESSSYSVPCLFCIYVYVQVCMYVCMYVCM